MSPFDAHVVIANKDSAAGWRLELAVDLDRLAPKCCSIIGKRHPG